MIRNKRETAQSNGEHRNGGLLTLWTWWHVSVGTRMQEGRGREEKRMNNDDNTIGNIHRKTLLHCIAFENLFFSKNQPLVWFVTCLRLLLPPHTSTLTSSQLLLFPVHGIKSDDERAKARSALTAHKRREFSFSVYIRRHSNLQQWLRGSKCESGLFDTERCGQQHYVLTLSSWETNAHSKRPFRQFFFFF